MNIFWIFVMAFVCAVLLFVWNVYRKYGKKDSNIVFYGVWVVVLLLVLLFFWIFVDFDEPLREQTYLEWYDDENTSGISYAEPIFDSYSDWCEGDNDEYEYITLFEWELASPSIPSIQQSHFAESPYVFPFETFGDIDDVELCIVADVVWIDSKFAPERVIGLYVFLDQKEQWWFVGARIDRQWRLLPGRWTFMAEESPVRKIFPLDYVEVVWWNPPRLFEVNFSSIIRQPWQHYLWVITSREQRWLINEVVIAYRGDWEIIEE